jgi:hypothetical protein
MHLQIRTSPEETTENVQKVLDVLAEAGVNVEGIGPDFEPPHVRVAVPHAYWDQALDALRSAGLDPQERAAITYAIPNSPGQLAPIIHRLLERGFTLESTLVLASRYEDRTLVSIGVREFVPPGWEERVIDLGGWEEPEGWTGEERAG